MLGGDLWHGTALALAQDGGTGKVGKQKKKSLMFLLDSHLIMYMKEFYKGVYNAI